MEKLTAKQEQEIKAFIKKEESRCNQLSKIAMDNGEWPEHEAFVYGRKLKKLRHSIRNRCSVELYAYLTDIIEENDKYYHLYSAINAS